MENNKTDLSVREREILSLLVEGHSYKAIAELCSISFYTLNTHLKNIYKKFGVNTATAAVSKAIRQKLL